MAFRWWESEKAFEWRFAGGPTVTCLNYVRKVILRKCMSDVYLS